MVSNTSRNNIIDQKSAPFSRRFVTYLPYVTSNGNTQCKIQKFCRVCGHKLFKIYDGGKRESQTKYTCAAFSMELFTCFAMDIRNDTVDFPTSFCRACRRAMCKVQEAVEYCIQVYGKAIQLATTLPQYLQGKRIHIM